MRLPPPANDHFLPQERSDHFLPQERSDHFLPQERSDVGGGGPEGRRGSSEVARRAGGGSGEVARRAGGVPVRWPGRARGGRGEVARTAGGFSCLLAAVGFALMVACAQPEPPSTTVISAPDGQLDCLPKSLQWTGHGDFAEDARGYPTTLHAAQVAAREHLRPGDTLVQIDQFEFSVFRQGREVVVISVTVAPGGGFLAPDATGCDE